MRESTKQLKMALEARIKVETLYVKGCFVAKGGTRYSIDKARKLTGIEAPERRSQRLAAWGDMATIAGMNGGLL